MKEKGIEQSARARLNPNLARDHLANERTLLAWVRTALAIIALGFLVAKAETSLLPARSGHGGGRADSTTGALVLGVGLVLAGAVLLIAASASYRRTARQIEENDFRASPLLSLLVSAVLVISAVGLAIYLLKTA